MNGNIPMNTSVFEKFAVNRPGQIEATRQPLYDYQEYAAAGQTQLTFFQTPAGQGGKTRADTNMETAGALPNPKRHLIEGISIQFFPGAAVLPGQGPIAAAIDAFTNDVYEVFSGAAWVELFIGSKSYLQVPINAIPATTGLVGWSSQSDATTAAAALFTRTAYARAGGLPFKVSPELLLEPTQNFNVTINWPTAVGISAAGRIGVHLHGISYRNSQ